MPTNEERREVAEELRYTASHSLNGYSFQRAVEGIAFGGLEDRPWRQILNRLADLIEPEERTCKFMPYSEKSDDGICSKCGAYMYEQDNYCPDCGARVKEEANAD